MDPGVFSNGIDIRRGNRIIYVRFLVPHRVISTCRAAGGIQQSLEYLYNHQACEPTGHHRAIAAGFADKWGEKV